MVTAQRDQTWWFKLNGASRHAIARGALNMVAPPIVVTEYPKSGGTWTSQMLSAALDIPYPRNRLPHLRKQILHGCYRRVHPNIKTIVLWRDGRDTMVSFYYHLMFEKPITSGKYHRYLVNLLGIEDPYDIENNLPNFIEWCFNGGYPGFSWTDFVRIWIDRDTAAKTSYEALLDAPEAEITRILGKVTDHPPHEARVREVVAAYSFESQSNRKRGDTDVTQFVRKGIAGDWKNCFTQKAGEVFHKYAQAELEQLGYEQNSDWVEDLKP